MSKWKITEIANRINEGILRCRIEDLTEEDIPRLKALQDNRNDSLEKLIHQYLPERNEDILDLAMHDTWLADEEPPNDLCNTAVMCILNNAEEWLYWNTIEFIESVLFDYDNIER